MGIHLGDVVEESDGDLMGDGINIAARLEGIALGPARSVCPNKPTGRSRGEFSIWRSPTWGPTQLKNIAEPVRAYSLEVGIPAAAKPVTGAVA